MSNSNNERRELTTAELDLVSGGKTTTLESVMISGVVAAGGVSRGVIALFGSDYADSIFG